MSNSSFMGAAAKLLSDGSGDPDPFEPWWKDHKKLVDAALSNNEDMRKVFLDELLIRAQKDVKLRAEINAIMIKAGEGQRGNRTRRPLHQDFQIFFSVELLLQHGMARSKEDAFEQVSNLMNKSPSSVKGIYQAAKRNPQINISINQTD